MFPCVGLDRGPQTQLTAQEAQPQVAQLHPTTPLCLIRIRFLQTQVWKQTEDESPLVWKNLKKKQACKQRRSSNTWIPFFRNQTVKPSAETSKSKYSNGTSVETLQTTQLCVLSITYQLSSPQFQLSTRTRHMYGVEPQKILISWRSLLCF